jgi:UDP-N-acetylmuramate--alanine ligase
MTATYSPPPGSIPTLDVPDISDLRVAHMIGIGGAGMRNLAKLLIARGVRVTGSDLKDSRGLAELARAGAEVSVGHEPSHVGKPDAVIISSAIGASNPELLRAREQGSPVWARAQVLAALAEGKRAIAVVGTHGKTTTTSMLATILERAGLDPTYLIGGDLNETGSGARSGSSDIFVAEADESDGSFLLLQPTVAILTNVEVDHVDFYTGGIEEIRAAFARFLASASAIVACGDDEGAAGAVGAAGREADAVTFGVGDGNAVRIAPHDAGMGRIAGTIERADVRVELSLKVGGLHNLLDATAALLGAESVGVPWTRSAEILGGFAGVHRRFELRGQANGASFYDDYGHIPTELSAGLKVARELEPNRLVAVFQPHRYWRTQALWRELGEALLEADLIVVTDVFGAEQDPIPGVSGELVVEGIHLADPSKPVVYLPRRPDVVGFLASEVRSGDLVITLGCGDIYTYADAALRLMGVRP